MCKQQQISHLTFQTGKLDLIYIFLTRFSQSFRNFRQKINEQVYIDGSLRLRRSSTPLFGISLNFQKKETSHLELCIEHEDLKNNISFNNRTTT